MSDFNTIKHAVSNQVAKLVKIADESELFEVDVDKNELWDLYLNSFPEGTDPIYKTRTEHNCNCCKQFIRQCGGVIAFKNGEMHTVWDSSSKLDDHYGVVASKLAEYIKTKPIKNIFRHFQKDVGVDKSRQLIDDKVITWGHFHYSLPSKYYQSNRSVDTIKGEALTNKEVLKSSLEMIEKSAIDIVLELIAQNSLYRGEEFKRTVEMVLKLKKEYTKLKTDIEKDAFLWMKSLELKESSKIKNMAIGTLLVDLSKGIDIEDAVKMFESKVAPQNYKRSKTLVTKGMIEEAEKKVVDLGIQDSLYRRYAVSTDITVNNVLFADRKAKQAMTGGIFDELKADAKEKTPDFDKIEEVTIENFLTKILPNVTSVDVWFDTSQQGNLMSLIAPKNPTAARIFKWKNNFSWSYNGDVTDSIKERVKRAGGNVTGFLRCSLSWHNHDDLDIHVQQPNSSKINFINKRDAITGGNLDVDANAGGGNTRTPVENVTWPSKDRLKEGNYSVDVNQYCNRETSDIGFEVEIECDGKSYFFAYDKDVPNKQTVNVAVFNYTRKDGFKLVKSIGEKSASVNKWGISTQKFHRTSMILNSPNHWDGESTGNRHVFFILEDCANPESARGFYNEFLLDDLTPHRKVFEVLGSKLKVEESSEQLSGLGFSSTLKSEVICRVKGSFNRTIKVKF